MLRGSIYRRDPTINTGVVAERMQKLPCKTDGSRFNIYVIESVQIRIWRDLQSMLYIEA